MGYFLDTKSYPGEKVVYVVSYTRPNRSEGYVFTVFLGQKHGRGTFNIQNNAKFVRSNKKGTEFPKQGVSFSEPPLWGLWTQEHIAMAIQRIGYQPVVEVSIKDLQKPSPPTQCESYVSLSNEKSR